MKNKILAGGVSALLAVGALTLAFAAPASAHTPGATATCDALTVSASYYETKPGQDAIPPKTHIEYQRYSWNPKDGDKDRTPGDSTPLNDPEHWQKNTGNYEGAGHGSDPVGEAFQKADGDNASWFFWTSKTITDDEGSAAVSGDATPNTVTVTIDGKQADSQEFGTSFSKSYDFVDRAVAHDWIVSFVAWNDPDGKEGWTKTLTGTSTPCVPTTPPTPSVQPIVCTATGSWYSEDGGDPAVKPEGIVFTATGHAPGLDYRVPVTGNLQGWDSLAYTATGSDQLFPRLVIDASADGGKAYQSLSFPATNPVMQDSVAYQTGKSIKQMAEQWPHAVITSVGFSMNSGAAAGDKAVLTSVTSPCIARNFVVNQPKDYVEWGTWSNPVVTCDNEAGDVVQQYRTNVYVTTEWKDGQWVEVRTEKATHKNHTVTQAEIDALECAVVTPPVVTPPAVTPPTVNKPVPVKPAPVVKGTVDAKLASTGGEINPWPLAVGGVLTLGGLLCLVSMGATRARRKAER